MAIRSKETRTHFIECESEKQEDTKTWDTLADVGADTETGCTLLVSVTVVMTTSAWRSAKTSTC